jgi:hypothetical protein
MRDRIARNSQTLQPSAFTSEAHRNIRAKYVAGCNLSGEVPESSLALFELKGHKRPPTSPVNPQYGRSTSNDYSSKESNGQRTRELEFQT